MNTTGASLIRGGRATYEHVNGYVETLVVRAARRLEPCHAVGCERLIQRGELRGRNLRGYYSICAVHLTSIPAAVVERQRAERRALYAVHEDALEQQFRGSEIAMRCGWIRQVPAGKWRWDFMLSGESLVLVDIQGSTSAGRQGKHTSHAGMTNDYEKHNAAIMLGYRVLLFTGEQVQDGTALRTIEEALMT